ncbi:MAG: hypothetical protein ACRDQY_15325 [Pseudonocardiaceae bacterium]
MEFVHQPADSGDATMSRETLMSMQLIVEGGRPLAGELRPAGFKHALVTLCAAALVGRARVQLVNCPDLLESRVLGVLLRSLGGSVVLDRGTLTLDFENLHFEALDPKKAGSIHGSIYLLPGLLSRFGRAVVPQTGGCRIGGSSVSAATSTSSPATDGARPVQQYLDILHRFGVKAWRNFDGAINAKAHKLHSCHIDLRDFTSERRLRTGPLYSGATKMAILCAAVAQGDTRLLHPYPKPDVTELVDLLAAMGADIQYVTPHELAVVGRGPEVLTTPVRHILVTDLIEIITWACLATLTWSPLLLTGVTARRALVGLEPEVRLLERMGVALRSDRQGTVLWVERNDKLRAVHEIVSSHGIYSDNQPLLSLLTTEAAGTSTFIETVWTERFGHVCGLNKMGAKMTIAGNVLAVNGMCRPNIGGRTVHAPDLRAAAALTLAALMVPGTTTITGAHHLLRGYHDLRSDLHALGADVREILHERTDPTLGF